MAASSKYTFSSFERQANLSVILCENTLKYLATKIALTRLKNTSGAIRLSFEGMRRMAILLKLCTVQKSRKWNDVVLRCHFHITFKLLEHLSAMKCLQ